MSEHSHDKLDTEVFRIHERMTVTVKNQSFHSMVYYHKDDRCPDIPGMVLVHESKYWTLWRWLYA